MCHADRTREHQRSAEDERIVEGERIVEEEPTTEDGAGEVDRREDRGRGDRSPEETPARMLGRIRGLLSL